MFLPFLLKPLLALLGRTCQIEIRGLHRFCDYAAKERCILMCWHNRLLFMPYFLSRFASSFRYSAFISHSRDGQLLASFAKSYSAAEVITVPHNARHVALKEMVNKLEKEQRIILITPDGPRGPRYQVKPGATLAAKITESYVIPFSWAASRFWQLNTWDKMIIPKPFSRIIVEWGTPHLVKKHDSSSLSQKNQELESLLHFSGKALYEELLPDQQHWPK